jgi:hypothetical protein
VELDDPERLLAGKGHQVRHIVLKDARDLDQPGIRVLISPKQRPRRPAASRATTPASRR